MIVGAFSVFSQTKVIPSDPVPSKEWKLLRSEYDRLRGELDLFQIKLRANYSNHINLFTADPTQNNLNFLREKIDYIEESGMIELCNKMDEIHFKMHGSYPEVEAGTYLNDDLRSCKKVAEEWEKEIRRREETDKLVKEIEQLDKTLKEEGELTDVLEQNLNGQYVSDNEEFLKLENKMGAHDTNFVLKSKWKGKSNYDYWVEDLNGNIIYPKIPYKILAYSNGVVKVRKHFKTYTPCEHFNDVDCDMIISIDNVTHAYKVGYINASGEFVDGLYKIEFEVEWHGPRLTLVEKDYDTVEERLAEERRRKQLKIWTERKEREIHRAIDDWKKSIR